MNTILARFNIIAGKEAEAEEAMKKQAASVESAEPGALTYILHRNRKNPSEITVFEVYADDDASTVHRGKEHMGAFRGHFGSIFDPATVKIDRLERIAGFSALAEGGVAPLIPSIPQDERQEARFDCGARGRRRMAPTPAPQPPASERGPA